MCVCVCVCTDPGRRGSGPSAPSPQPFSPQHERRGGHTSAEETRGGVRETDDALFGRGGAG